jgi:hypothetical protein
MSKARGYGGIVFNVAARSPRTMTDRESVEACRLMPGERRWSRRLVSRRGCGGTLLACGLIVCARVVMTYVAELGWRVGGPGLLIGSCDWSGNVTIGDI